MITTVKEKSRIHFEKGKLNVKSDIYYLYKLINQQSIAGYEFMLVNAMSTHAFCLSEDFFTFENIQSEMQECIQDDYRKINFSVDFDTQKLDSIMHQKFGEDEYIFRVSTDEKVAKVENFEITVVGNRYREYDFSKSDLPFKPKENADLFNNLVDIFTPMILLMNYLNSSNTDLPN